MTMYGINKKYVDVCSSSTDLVVKEYASVYAICFSIWFIFVSTWFIFVRTWFIFVSTYIICASTYIDMIFNNKIICTSTSINIFFNNKIICASTSINNTAIFYCTSCIIFYDALLVFILVLIIGRALILLLKL